MEKYEGRTMFQSINTDWEKIIVPNFTYHDYTNQRMFDDNASDY